MEWQPIETAPKDGTDILVCAVYNIGSDEWITSQWVDYQMIGASWPTFWSRIDLPVEPTHWMPLPQPPEE